MTLDLTTLIPKCHEASKANGWWEPKPNAGQQLMLVISELSEALEADRNGNKGDLLRYLKESAEWHEAREGRGQLFDAALFKELVKDSVADELADAYIRLCDFAGGFGLDIDALMATENEWYDLCAGVGQNLGEALLSITHDVASAWVNEYETAKEVPLGTAMAEIRLLTEREDIDLATHIDLKLQYNATRGQKHGGKAY